MTQQRLQKLISAAGICSRRRADELLIQQRIEINGKIAKLGDKADPNLDKVKIDGTRIRFYVSYKVILINKPKGVISTCHDTHGRRTITSLLPIKLRKGLYPVGRLDLESRGAILLTNHGELTLQLTHPRFSHSKTYLVKLQGIPSNHSLQRWREGIKLDGKKTMNAQIHVLNSSKDQSLLKVVIKEGRNRQIRRIADLLGYPVIDLQRISIANIELNGLDEGCWREVNRNEWEKLLKNYPKVV